MQFKLGLYFRTSNSSVLITCLKQLIQRKDMKLTVHRRRRTSMENTKVFNSILSGRAILITGSGVNVGVKNHEGIEFPIGKDLTKLIYNKCGITNPDDEYDLQDASQTYLEQKSAQELINLLKQTYNVGSLSDAVKILYNLPWCRCYTTNYDDVPMLATDKKMIPITLSEKTERLIDEKASCVYINGYIGKLNERTLETEFKLTTVSYLSTENILNSQWGIVLKRDIEFADVVIIAGLSLDYDLDLKRIIYSPEIINKVIFVEKKDISEDKKRKMNRIGQVWDIGLEEFTKHIQHYMETEYVPEETMQRLICFEKNYPINVTAPAKTLEIYNLFSIGEISSNLFWKEGGKYTSLVYRNQIADIMSAINNKVRLIFLHANLENGKSILLEMLKQQLYKRDICTYTFLEGNNRREFKDIKNIMMSEEPKVIIIENYFNHLDVLREFSLYKCENVSFVLTARTMVYETKISEVHTFFNITRGESVSLDINKLDKREIYNCYSILDRNEFWGSYAKLNPKEKKKLLVDKNAGNSELQTILLKTIYQSVIRKKIDNIVKSVKDESGNYYSGLIIMLLSKVMSLELNIADINTIMGISCLIDVQYKENPAVKELVEFKQNGKMDFKIKSAVIAKVILNDIDNSADIIEALVKIANYANLYSETNRFEGVLQNIVSFSHVNSFLNRKRDNIEFIIDYYDSLKNISYYKNNSFFWLQYSIACMRYKNYELAQNYVEVAYAKFRKSEINIPFQCDNQQARIYLELIRNGKSVNVKSDLEHAHALIMKPIVSEKDREESTIRLLNIYVDRNFIKQIDISNLKKEYCVFCGEAYNKVKDFLHNMKNERDRERYENLKDKLLRCSAIDE